MQMPLNASFVNMNTGISVSDRMSFLSFSLQLRKHILAAVQL